MAVEVDDAEQIIDDTGDAYTVPSEPSDPLLLSLWLCSKGSATIGTVTHTVGGQAFENNDGTVGNGGSSPYVHSDAYWTTSNGTWPSTGSQTVVLTSTTAFANEGICIVSLSGVDQTTPITGFQSQKTESVTQLSFSSVSADVGDMIYMIATVNTDRTLDANPSAPGTNTWDTAPTANNAAIVSGGLAKGSVYRLPVTQAISSATITIDADTTATSFGATLLVVEQSVGGAPNTRRYSQTMTGIG